jgi:hypothetical protein
MSCWREGALVRRRSVAACLAAMLTLGLGAVIPASANGGQNTEWAVIRVTAGDEGLVANMSWQVRTDFQTGDVAAMIYGEGNGVNGGSSLDLMMIDAGGRSLSTTSTLGGHRIEITRGQRAGWTGIGVWEGLPVLEPHETVVRVVGMVSGQLGDVATDLQEIRGHGVVEVQRGTGGGVLTFDAPDAGGYGAWAADRGAGVLVRQSFSAAAGVIGVFTPRCVGGCVYAQSRPDGTRDSGPIIRGPQGDWSVEVTGVLAEREMGAWLAIGDAWEFFENAALR